MFFRFFQVIAVLFAVGQQGLSLLVVLFMGNSNGLDRFVLFKNFGLNCRKCFKHFKVELVYRHVFSVYRR